jgi:cell division protein FtsB
MKIFSSKRYFGLTGYQILFLGALVAMLFVFSDNGVTKWLGYHSEIRRLESQIDYYRHRSEVDRRRLNELQSNTQDLEKFARENYLMRRDNEDVFIIVD